MKFEIESKESIKQDDKKEDANKISPDTMVELDDDNLEHVSGGMKISLIKEKIGF